MKKQIFFALTAHITILGCTNNAPKPLPKRVIEVKTAEMKLKAKLMRDADVSFNAQTKQSPTVDRSTCPTKTNLVISETAA